MEVFQPSHQSIDRQQSSTTTNTILKMAGDIQVTVPDSIESMTTYVLLEQRDWFEQELTFLRSSLRPGCQMLDIGANHGVYALSLARVIGPQGKIFAIEPTPETFARLKNSLSLNQFENISAFEIGLSNVAGTASLAIHSNSELNRVVNDPSDTVGAIQIELQTLDQFVEQNKIGTVNFLKLDAEGLEEKIIDGGKTFFRDQSPLVMFEVKHDDTVNFALIKKFTELDYEIYQLVPGLNLLRRFDPQEPWDSFQLNLFACQADRATAMQNQGILARDTLIVTDSDADAITTNELYYQRFLESFPYAERMKDLWSQAKSLPELNTYQQGLSDYALAHDCHCLSPSERIMLLNRAYVRFQNAIAVKDTFSRVSSLIRVSWELGYRMPAVQQLNQLMQTVTEGSFDLGEPFLCVADSFDRIDPGKNLGNWFVASIFTQFELLSANSSYFLGQDHRQLLETISKTGFVTADMRIRLELLKKRFVD